MKKQDVWNEEINPDFISDQLDNLNSHVWDRGYYKETEDGFWYEVYVNDQIKKYYPKIDLNDEEQKYMCFHWTNLQPMWGQENSEKSDNYDPKTFRYKWIDRETGWVGIPKYLMNK